MTTRRVFLAMLPIAASPVVTAQQALPRPTYESAHFEIVAAASWVPAEMEQRFDEIYAVVAERLGVSLETKIRMSFAPPNPRPCRQRGALMFPSQGSESDRRPVIWIFADKTTDPKQISAVWAHELGHAIQYLAVDGGRSIASIFVEGFATWAAGPYWLDWKGEDSFRSVVASYIEAGTYLPLHENDGWLDTVGEDAVARFGDDCLNQRDIIYTEWAAFIDYLVEEHGREKLYSLFLTPPLVSEDEATPFKRPNFPAVYGSSLERLEAAWLARLEQ
jgi:hypothetical protein